uniref:Uncharacterized protein n=1 Tax=Zea mays TaxID=4577 RepID=A0A804QYN5_MAIZE
MDRSRSSARTPYPRSSALVDQQSSYVCRTPRRLVRYTTTRPALSGAGAGGEAFLASFVLVLLLALIFSWNTSTRARTMPGNVGIPRVSTSPPPPPPLRFAAEPGSGEGEPAGVAVRSSSAFRNASRRSGSSTGCAGDPGADCAFRSTPSPSPTPRTLSSVASSSSSSSSRPSMSSHTLISSGSRPGVLLGVRGATALRGASTLFGRHPPSDGPNSLVPAPPSTPSLPPAFVIVPDSSPPPAPRPAASKERPAAATAAAARSRLSVPSVDERSATECRGGAQRPDRLCGSGARAGSPVAPCSACLEPLQPMHVHRGPRRRVRKGREQLDQEPDAACR